jgi:intracellular multiplication protein IcmQ
MKDKLTKQQTDAILEALDKAIETGPWNESNFLRVIGKNLQGIRDNFANLLNGGSDQQSGVETISPHQAALRATQKEIFIALYSSEGSNLQSWERILANLPRQLVSRPIYDEEEGVKYLIKSKENKTNEAYVVAYVSQVDILNIQSDKGPVDKFGKPLMTIKDRSLNLDNISRFVHISGIYLYKKGRLIKEST